MELFDSMNLFEPSSIDVIQIGDKVYGRGITPIIDNGHFKTLGIAVFNREIGIVGPCLFDDIVRDQRGHKIGVLEGGLVGPKTLRRW
jgi:hypothetical protein